MAGSLLDSFLNRLVEFFIGSSQPHSPTKNRIPHQITIVINPAGNQRKKQISHAIQTSPINSGITATKLTSPSITHEQKPSAKELTTVNTITGKAQPLRNFDLLLELPPELLARTLSFAPLHKRILARGACRSTREIIDSTALPSPQFFANARPSPAEILRIEAKCEELKLWPVDRRNIFRAEDAIKLFKQADAAYNNATVACAKGVATHEAYSEANTLFSKADELFDELIKSGETWAYIFKAYIAEYKCPVDNNWAHFDTAQRYIEKALGFYQTSANPEDYVGLNPIYYQTLEGFGDNLRFIKTLTHLPPSLAHLQAAETFKQESNKFLTKTSAYPRASFTN